MVRVSATHLKAVAVALTRVMIQGDGNGVAVTVNYLRTYFLIEPICFVHTQRTRVLRHIVVGTAVHEADTVLDDRVGRADALEEIPTVIGVVPCPAADIVVSVTGKLLVGKTVCVTAEIGRIT